jgi:hypothetical protein
MLTFEMGSGRGETHGTRGLRRIGALGRAGRLPAPDDTSLQPPTAVTESPVLW